MFTLEEMEVVIVGEECVRVKKEIVEDVKEEESCDEITSKVSKCLSLSQQQRQHHKYYISRAVFLINN